MRRARNVCAPKAPAATAMNAEMLPARANPLSIDAAAGDLHSTHALDATRSADERRHNPADEAHNDRPHGCGKQPGDLESGHEPGNERERDAVHDQDEESQGDDG